MEAFTPRNLQELGEDYFKLPPSECAKTLLGTVLANGDRVGIIVETEAYLEKNDSACHLHFRPSIRKFYQKNKPGTAYVYLNYGMYWLTNVLVRSTAGGGFVLFRALEPLIGKDQMATARKKNNELELCSGPGKLSMALGIDASHNGTAFNKSDSNNPLKIFKGLKSIKPSDIISEERIGISKSKDLKLRFYIKNNKFVSKTRKTLR